MKKRSITIGLLLFILGMQQHGILGQDKISQEEFTRDVGMWHAEGQDMLTGKAIHEYKLVYFEKSLEMLGEINLAVDSEDKTLSSTFTSISKIDSKGKQFSGMGFGSRGIHLNFTGIISGMTRHVQLMAVLTNKTRASINLKATYSEDGQTLETSGSNAILGGNYAKQLPTRTWKRINEDINQLAASGAIIFPEGVNEGPLKERFSYLLGNWEKLDDKGNIDRAYNWSIMNMGKCLIERWGKPKEDGSGIEGGGINVTAIDPSNGRLTMWSIHKGGFSRSGGWDFLEPGRITGQRQGNVRIIRKLTSTGSIEVYRQNKKNGSYSGKFHPYNITRKTN